MYKQATREQWRFTTPKGNLTVEQLWTLSVEELDKLAVSLDEEYAKSGKKSFLVRKSVKDRRLKGMLDVTLDILNTKQEENEQAALVKETKEHNEKILRLIAEKKDENLKNMSISDLEKQLR